LQQPPLVADEEETYEFKDDEIKTDPLRNKNKSDSPEAVVPSESPISSLFHLLIWLNNYTTSVTLF
jgi:hypothetical protein